MPSRLIVVRHAETTWNAERRWAGKSDPKLSALGCEQAAALGVASVGTGIDRVVASDLGRARDTAEAVRTACGLPDVVVDPRWRERDVGAWEGRTSAEIDAAWPGLLDEWRQGRLRDLPDGEPWDAFLQRVTDALGVLTDADGTTLVVTHAGVFRAIEAMFELSVRHIPNTSGLVLDFGAAVLVTPTAPHGR